MSSELEEKVLLSPRQVRRLAFLMILGVYAVELGESAELVSTQNVAVLIVAGALTATFMVVTNEPFAGVLIGPQVMLVLGYFVLPVFKHHLQYFRGQSYHTRHFSLDDEDVLEAVVAAGLAITAMFVGHYLSKSLPFGRRGAAAETEERVQLPARGVQVALWVIAAAQLRLPSLIGDAAAKFFSGNVAMLAVAGTNAITGGIIYEETRRSVPRSSHFSLLIVGALSCALIGALNGFGAQMAAPLLACGFAIVMAGRLRAKWLLGGIIAIPAVIAFMSIKADLRARSWTTGQAADLTSSVNAFSAILDEKIKGIESRATSANADIEDIYNSNTRLQATNILAHVINATPDRVPYWAGETYSKYFWIFVPRFLYPWKPSIGFGQEFPHRYGLLDPGDTVTSFNMLMLVEAYANFGVVGVCVHYLVFGVLLGLFEAWLRDKSRNSWVPYGVGTYLATSHFFGQESGTFGMSQSFVTAVVVYVIFTWLGSGARGDGRHALAAPTRSLLPLGPSPG